MAICPNCKTDNFSRVKNFGYLCFNCDYKVPDSDRVIQKLGKKEQDKPKKLNINWNDFEGEIGW